MRLSKLTLREIHLRLISPFETSFGKTDLRRIVLVEAEIDGISGWGESTAGENPYYCYETVETSWHILRDHIWYILKGREVGSASEVSDMLARVRGHNMTKASIETAFWDAEAKLKNVPLAKLLGGTREEISCGVSIGIQPSLPDLIAKVEKELAAGYQRIKIKIKPGQDIEPVRALRERFPQIRLMVDANSAYRLEDTPLLKQLDAFYLIMIEQPLGYADIFSRRVATPARNSDLPRRMHSRHRACACRDRPGRLSHHQHKTRPRWRPYTSSAATRSLPVEVDSRMVRRHARIGHRARAQYCDVLAAKFLPAGRCFREPSLLGRRYHRA